MSVNGQPSDAHVLRWPGRLLAADDLRRSLNGHRELVLSPRAIVTPLAADELRSRGVQVRREDEETPKQPAAARWGFAQDRPNPVVHSAVQAIEREGAPLKELQASGDEPCRWARAVAECVASGACQGGVLFCHDPGLVCCVANKLPGLRAAAVLTVAQAARATLQLGANLLAVEMPGRTFFEVRQILRTVCLPPVIVCPSGVACTLQELDGHAHR
jgi:Ribose/Galactose Isomerase